jgi:hypothetical protein
MSPRSGNADQVSGSRRRHRSELDAVEAEARYHRERLALYRARVLSAKPTSYGRLQELERKAAAADIRLRHARDGEPR